MKFKELIKLYNIVKIIYSSSFIKFEPQIFTELIHVKSILIHLTKKLTEFNLLPLVIMFMQHLKQDTIVLVKATLNIDCFQI